MQGDDCKAEEDEMREIITIKDVWKIYKMGQVEIPALQGLNFELMPGDFAIIMGPSGSGKSTAMYLIGCLDLPTKGHIFLDGQDISHLEESELAQIRGKKIGFVFQQFNLLPALTALENVMLPMCFQRKPDSYKIERAKKLLNLVENGTLRFEVLVELIRDLLDPKLRIIDYYGECDKNPAERRT